MDMGRRMATVRLRSAPTATTTIIPTRVRHMATTVPTGSLAACSSAPVRGTAAGFTGIAGSTVAGIMAVGSMDAAATTEVAGITDAGIMADVDLWGVADSQAAEHVADSRVAATWEASMAEADFMVAAAFTAAGTDKH